MRYLFLLFYTLLTIKIQAQNLETLKTANPVAVSGNIGWNQMFYQANLPRPSRQPQTWIFNGNLNFSFFSHIQAPFSFSYSNQGSKFTQPTYNFTSFHPSYKWVQLHVGNISQNWSSYTVNGHMFRGVAVELSPAKFKIQLLSGRFLKAVQPDSFFATNRQICYKRIGRGIKLGWNRNRGQVSFSGFRALDDTNSLPNENYPVLSPKENRCLGLSANQKWGKYLSTNADYSYSWINEDIRITKAATARYRAFKIGAELAFAKWSLHSQFERVDPDYRSFGSYYFNNDLQNVQLGFSTGFFKRKMQLSANIGRQSDNVDGSKLSQMNRTALSANLQISLSKKMGVQGSYSNFSSYTNQQPFRYSQVLNPYIQWDSLQYRQVSENYTASLHCSFRADTIRVSAMQASFAYQKSADQSGAEKQVAQGFYNANASYSLNLVKTGLNFMASLNYNATQLPHSATMAITPALGLGSTLLKKKMRLQCSYGSSRVFQNRVHAQAIQNFNGAIAYQPAKGHQLRLNLQYQSLGGKARAVMVLIGYSGTGEWVWKRH